MSSLFKLAALVLICTGLLIFLSGCVMGIPDYYPPPPKPKPCDVRITDGRVMHCYTRDEFQRWRRKNEI
jgi:hypothetical protein